MKTVLDLARQAGWTGPEDNLAYITMLERFAKLVLAHNPPQSFMSWQEGYEAGRQAEREACADLVWPKLKVWSIEELTAMGLAFNRAQEKHGWYETLMAVGASVLKLKAAAIRARGNT